MLGPLWLTKALRLRGVLGEATAVLGPPQPPPPGLVTDPRLAQGLSVISRARDLLRHPAGGSHDCPPSGLDRGCRGGPEGVQCGRKTPHPPFKQRRGDAQAGGSVNKISSLALSPPTGPLPRSPRTRTCHSA